MGQREFSLNDAFQITGEWWIPENLDNRVHGKLVFTPESGLSLELDDTLKPANWVVHFYPIRILGRSTDGASICLRHCRVTSTIKTPAREESNTVLRAQEGYIGKDFGITDNYTFKTLFVHYAYLTDWVHRTGFNIDTGKFSEGKFTIEYARPERIRARVNDYEISVVIEPPPSLPLFTHHLQLKEEAWIVISAGQEMFFDDFLQVLRDLQTFLTLGMNKATCPLRIKGVGKATELTRDDGTHSYGRADIVYQLPFPPKEIGTLSPITTLFTLPMIEDKFELYIANWLNKANLLRPVYDLFCASIENPFLFSENIFLNYVFALETYHRRKFQGKYQSDETYLNGLYKTLVDAIPDGLEPDFKQSLEKGKLRYANEYSFRSRLKKILGGLPKNLNLPILQSSIQQEIIDIINKTRNYYVHYDESLKDNIAKGPIFDYVIYMLACIVRIVLMQELGMGDDTVRNLVLPNTNIIFRDMFEPFSPTKTAPSPERK